MSLYNIPDVLKKVDIYNLWEILPITQAKKTTDIMAL